MGCPCRTHINTHLGPMWVLYFLLAGLVLSKKKNKYFLPTEGYTDLFCDKTVRDKSDPILFLAGPLLKAIQI